MNNDWMKSAACAGMDPDWWFPVRGESVIEAKKVCAGCPVTVECLTAALDSHREVFGLWGGLSERERRRLRAQRAAAPTPPPRAPRPAVTDGRPACEECGRPFVPTIRRPQRFCAHPCCVRWHSRNLTRRRAQQRQAS